VSKQHSKFLFLYSRFRVLRGTILNFLYDQSNPTIEPRSRCTLFHRCLQCIFYVRMKTHGTAQRRGHCHASAYASVRMCPHPRVWFLRTAACGKVRCHAQCERRYMLFVFDWFGYLRSGNACFRVQCIRGFRFTQPVDIAFTSVIRRRSWCETSSLCGQRPVSHRNWSEAIITRLLQRRHARNRRFGDRAFSVAATKAWNSLPTDLKTCLTDAFKRRLKT